METILESKPETARVEPLCPSFGACGGCAYQDLSYPRELEIKEKALKTLFDRELGLSDLPLDPVVPSPQPYHYRHRLDLTMKQTREGMILGFQPEGRRKMIPTQSCAIARREVSEFIPELFCRAREKWLPGYRTANLVVKTSDDGRRVWGGIGRHSLRLEPEDYLWTEIQGRRIYFSLDTFFQANLGILPCVMDRIRDLAALDWNTLFLDLYAGVGLFGVFFAPSVGAVRMVEDSAASVTLMRWNVAQRGMDPASVVPGRVEEVLPQILSGSGWPRRVAIVDPPRKGLHPEAIRTLNGAKSLERLFYLSCSPESLVRDLGVFLESGWRLLRITPFDFFPRTRHLETLVCLRP